MHAHSCVQSTTQAHKCMHELYIARYYENVVKEIGNIIVYLKVIINKHMYYICGSVKS